MLTEWVDGFVQGARTRRLDRVAIGYAVVGWIVVQAASIVLSSFNAPQWALRAIIIFILIGFPLALSTAWFAAPHVIAVQTHARRLGRPHAAFALVAVVLFVVAANFAYLLSQAVTPRTPIATATPAPVSAPAKNSIAVLPFVNMSGDPSKDYFSDGISEELLDELSEIPALLVAARTSSFAFKDKNENIRDIAHALAVRSVLEGSVRASGNHLRIAAQLIDAGEGYRLWAATYNRDLTDVLVVQDEIAQAITTALTHKLLPPPGPSAAQRARIIDAEAYRNYLLGQHELAPRTEEGTRAALSLFKNVTTAAPDFAEGFAALARAEINLAEYRPERSDLMPAAQTALTRAMTLDPKNISAVSSHLDLALHRLDWQTMIDDARLMQSINPNSIDVLHEMFRFYQFLGFPDLALDAASGAAKLNPLSFVDRLNVAAALQHNGRYADAVKAARAALTLEHDQPLVMEMLCNASAHAGDAATAKFAEVKLSALNDPSDLQSCQFEIEAAAGHTAQARVILDRQAQSFAHGGPSASELGEGYAVVGDNKQAIRWLERAYALKEYQLVLFPFEKVVPPGFFEDAAWKSYYARPLFSEWHLAHDRVAAEIATRG